MTDRQYIESGTGMVHVYVTWTRLPGAVRTLCGRTLLNRDDGHLWDRIPSDRPFCENCGRRLASQTDAD